MTDQTAVTADQLEHTFRAFWPITDPTVPVTELVAAAGAEVSWLATQAHARLTGPGRWSMSPSSAVPGSANIATTVLVFEAPATECPPRPYRLRVTR